MADNLSVNVTADATNLRRELTAANRDISTFGSTLKSLTQITREAGTATAEQTQLIQTLTAKYTAASAQAADLRAKLNDLKAANQSAAASTEQVSTAHGHMAGSAGVAREAVVMLHETMMGNYTRLVGSTMVLAERTNALHLAFQTLSGPIGAAAAAAVGLGVAFVALALHAHEAETALRGVYNAALLQGRGAAAAEADTKRFAQQMQDTGTVGRSASLDIAKSIGTIPGVADDVRAKLAAIAPALFEVWGKNAETTAKNIDQAFRSISSLRAFAEENRLLTGEQERSFKTAEDTKNAYDAQRIVIDALTARLKPAYDAYKDLTEQAKLATAVAATGAVDLTGALTPKFQMEPLRMPQAGTQAEDEQTRRADAVVEQYSGSLRKEAELKDALTQATERLSAAQSAGDANAVAAAQAAVQSIQTQLTQLKNPGDADWSAKIGLQAEEAANKAVVAASNAHQQRLQITEAGLRAELQVYQQASQDMTRTDAERLAMKRRAIDIEMSLAKDEATGSTQAAKQAFEAKVASFDGEIAAARGNVAQVIALEQQKLAYIRQLKGQESAEYQRAAKEETTAVAQAVNEQIRELEGAGQREVAAKRASLQDQVSLRQISKVQEMAQVEQLQQAVQAAELKQLDAIISGLDAGTLAYADAMKQRAKLVEQFGVENMKVQSEADNAAMQAAEKETAAYTQAFSQIGSSAERAFTGYLTYSTTWQKAEQQIARTVLTSFINLATTMAERWAVLQLAKATSSQAANAVQVAQDQSASATGLAAFIAALTAKQTAQTTSEATSAAVVGLNARTQIAAAAAEAAGWAFADSAAMGPPGLVAAPGAAAAAEATVMSFQAAVPAFDIGSNYVPADMLAMVHRGEIIVPQAQADQVRASGGFSLGGSGGHTFNYSPTFHGASADMARQSRRDFEGWSSKVIDTFRNGQTRLPGRA